MRSGGSCGGSGARRRGFTLIELVTVIGMFLITVTCLSYALSRPTRRRRT